jgi:hypothetical protein
LLLYSGTYEIKKIGIGRGRKSEEAILYETCKKNDREVVMIVRISEDNQIMQIPVSQLNASKSDQQTEEQESKQEREERETEDE